MEETVKTGIYQIHIHKTILNLYFKTQIMLYLD